MENAWVHSPIRFDMDVPPVRGGFQDGGMAEWALSEGRNSEWALSEGRNSEPDNQNGGGI